MFDLYTQFINAIVNLAWNDIKPYDDLLKTIKTLTILNMKTDKKTFFDLKIAVFGITKINIYITSKNIKLTDLKNNQSYELELKPFALNEFSALQKTLLKFNKIVDEKFYDDLMDDKYKTPDNLVFDDKNLPKHNMSNYK